MGCIQGGQSGEVQYECEVIGDSKSKRGVTHSELPQDQEAPPQKKAVALNEATLLDSSTVMIEVNTKPNNIQPLSREELTKAALVVSKDAINKIAFIKPDPVKEKHIIEDRLVKKAIKKATK